ncbi:MAG TPA: PQQ-dependent sugar dehydrogenase [Ohtaekwangia sp.]|uniref:PQQ-dependent sugar dehydrogenase n=1 Tax=Ohtaekwangia sp. TaxID=2066019 RepID=UPI002F91EC36
MLLLFFLYVGLFSCDDSMDDDDNGDSSGISASVYAERLDTPWELAFAPDGRLFITERPGRVSIVENNTVKPWLELDSVALEVGESGLLGLALDPDFAHNKYVYIGYTYAASKGPLKLVNKLVRYREDASDKPVFDRVLQDGIEGNYIHNSGPIEFGPDGKLYWAVGDRYVPALAQDTDVRNGKILRMNSDGSIPDDNPMTESYIYSYGHRNPQGLAFHPETKELWSTEHGPSDEQGCCMDEINRILPGRNYGWPVIRGSQQQAGMETPVYYSGDTTTWAPTGGFFITQGSWNGAFVFTGLRGQALYKASFSTDKTQIVKVDRYLHRTFGRLRNVVQGPDGNLYIAISNQDGRGHPAETDDRIIVISIDELDRIGPDHD